VFHLMRVVEHGLQKMATVFNITFPRGIEQETWNNIKSHRIVPLFIEVFVGGGAMELRNDATDRCWSASFPTARTSERYRYQAKVP
jgi:hypothetical protein